MNTHTHTHEFKIQYNKPFIIKTYPIPMKLRGLRSQTNPIFKVQLKSKYQDISNFFYGLFITIEQNTKNIFLLKNSNVQLYN